MGEQTKSNNKILLDGPETYKDGSINTSFKIMSIYNTPWISDGFNPAPLSDLDDGTNDICFMTADKSRTQLARGLIAIDDGSYY